MNSTEIEEVANAFSAVAQQFCEAVNAAEHTDRSSFLLQIYRVLPRLIDAALRWPAVAPSDAPESDRDVRLSDIEWKRIYGAVAATTTAGILIGRPSTLRRMTNLLLAA